MRERMQSSTHFVMICLTLLAVLLLFWAESARRQAKTVAAIKNLGGYVHYEKTRALWLRDLLGDDLVADVRLVAFSYPGLGGHWPSAISDLVDKAGHKITFKTEKRRLSHIKDNDLVCLRELPKLRELQLQNMGVTDAALRHVEWMTRLEKLSLEYTGISDAGLKHLRRMTKLRSLNLSGTNVTDAGLTHLAGDH